MGWNPVKEAEKKAKQAVDKVLKPAVDALRDGAESAIWKLRKETWATIEKKGKDTIDSIDKHVVDKIESEVKKIPGAVEKEIEKAFSALASAVTKEGLKAVKNIVSTADRELEKLAKNKPGLVDAINQLGGSIEIGPITLKYANFYTRTSEIADVLDTYINHPPELRREPILKMVHALGPDSVDTGISVQVVALVVGSKELGIGGSLDDISNDLFVELGDVILEAVGVPE